MKSWQQVDLGGNPEHEGAEQKIDRENVHRAFGSGRPTAS
jgi:hypothetical protein